MKMEDEEENDDMDEIVQEIDVYLSPELSFQLHLIQFPLQAASSSHCTSSRSEMTQPDVAMIKPQHGALQLEYPFPYHEGGGLGRKRIFESYQVPVVTHMALGRFDSTGSTLQLVPLSNVIQMRPSMEHMRPTQDNNGEAEVEPEMVTSQLMDASHVGSSTKLLFHRPESEKVATSRRSSYAYYQASKAAEPWIELQVQPEPSSSSSQSHRSQYNYRQHQQHNGHTTRKGKKQALNDMDHDITASYVKSLNYIPHNATSATQGDKITSILPTSEITIVEEFVVPSHDLTIFSDSKPLLSLPSSSNRERLSNSYPPTHSSHSSSTLAHVPSSTMTISNTTTSTIPPWKKDLATIVTNLLQGPGVPIPYLVIRSRFPMISSHITDEDLLEALSSCALLVRGNFVLKSSLLPISNVLVSDARDFILWIMNKYRLVHRDALIQVLCPDSKHTPYTMTMKTIQQNKSSSNTAANTHIISLDAIQGILGSIGRRTTNGVQLKVDDDTFVETNYPQFASLLIHYWTLKEQRLSKWIQLYEDLVVKVRTE